MFLSGSVRTSVIFWIPVRYDFWVMLFANAIPRPCMRLLANGWSSSCMCRIVSMTSAAAPNIVATGSRREN